MKNYKKAVSIPGIPYYTYDEMQQDIVALQAEYPAFFQVDSLGKSVEGRDITEVILGNENSKYHVLIQASMHAREYMNSILAMNQIEDYLQEKWENCRGLYRENEAGEAVCFHVIPMVNPDGVTLCQNRKNSRLWKANARGVDLNRNFDVGWESYIGTPGPASEGYKGLFPASEPETQAILKAAPKYDPVCCIAYHSSGNLIYWDYGCQGEIRSRETALAACVSASTGYPLHSTIADTTDSAGCSDYFVLKLGIPAVTIENGEEDCPLKAEEYKEIYRRNKNLWKSLELLII